MNTSRLHGLDALRGIAAAAVFINHVQSMFHFGMVIPIAAVSAVDLFWMLSGFVMARTYEHREIGVARFMAIRYRRLFWPMAIGSMIGLGVLLWTSGPSVPLIAAFLSVLVFMPWPHLGLFVVNLPAWSLFVEVVANFLHWLIFRRASNAVLLAMLFFFSVVFASVTIQQGSTYWGLNWPALGISIVRGLACYVGGLLLFRFHGDRPLPGFRWAIALLAPLLIAAQFVPPALGCIGFILLCPLIIRAALGLGQSRVARIAGAASFPLYAVHFPLLMAARALV